MPSATSAFGTANPGGYDPYPIESILAPLAAGGSQGLAASLLARYQSDNEAGNLGYQAQLGRQNQFAYDELRQKAVEALQKNALEAYKSPNLELAMTGDATRGLFGGTPTDVMQGVANRQNAADAAKTLQAQGTGLNQLSQGGFQAPAEAASSVTGIPGLPSLGPALVRAAQIKAAQSAANAAMGGGSVSTSLQGTTQTPDGLSIPFTTSGKNPNAVIENYRRLSGGVGDVLPPAPKSAPDTKTQAPTKVAKQDTGGTVSRSDAGNWTVVTDPSIVDKYTAGVRAKLPTLPKQMSDDISAAMARNGGKAVVAVDPRTGKRGIAGMSNVYPE